MVALFRRLRNQLLLFQDLEAGLAQQLLGWNHERRSRLNSRGIAAYGAALKFQSILALLCIIVPLLLYNWIERAVVFVKGKVSRGLFGQGLEHSVVGLLDDVCQLLFIRRPEKRRYWWLFWLEPLLLPILDTDVDDLEQVVGHGDKLGLMVLVSLFQILGVSRISEIIPTAPFNRFVCSRFLKLPFWIQWRILAWVVKVCCCITARLEIKSKRLASYFYIVLAADGPVLVGWQVLSQHCWGYLVDLRHLLFQIEAALLGFLVALLIRSL